MARLKEYYSKEVAPALMSKFSYKSTMQIPKLDKIVINVGAGEAKDNSKELMLSAQTFLLLQVRSLSSVRQESQLLTSNSEKVWQSAVRLH